MINRRSFLGLTISAGTSLALTPQLLRALQQSSGTLMQRAIPSSGEKLPVIGLSFSNHPSCADHAALEKVLRTFFDNGGRVFDAGLGNAENERFHATLGQELGIQNKLFWSTRGTPPAGPGGPPPPGTATVKGHVDMWRAKLEVPRMDLVMVPPQGDPTWLAALKEMKKEGAVRYVGVQVISDHNYPDLESVMRNEPIDFIGVDYDVGNRARVEDTILPLAQERGIGVMASFPFGNNGGGSCGGSGTNLFGRVGDRPLPEWAADFDATTWAQFFIKYLLGHPAVTVVRTGTTKPHHMLDNIGGGIGRLPDEATRKQMAALIDSIPPVVKGPPQKQAPEGPAVVLPAAVLDRYVGAYEAASGFTLVFRRDGATLFAKPGPQPEAPLAARSDTRFEDPRGPIVEFQLDAQGEVTGAILEQGEQRIPLERK